MKVVAILFSFLIRRIIFLVLLSTIFLPTVCVQRHQNYELSVSKSAVTKDYVKRIGRERKLSRYWEE